jgi:hypothetical protein
MNKLIKIVSAAIIIFIFAFCSVAAWKIINDIHQEARQGTQCPFSSTHKEYGKR